MISFTLLGYQGFELALPDDRQFSFSYCHFVAARAVNVDLPNKFGSVVEFLHSNRLR